MEKRIELEISGIQCDNPDCNFIDDTVKMEDYPTYIGKPCPSCGENLLTQEDYDNVMHYVKAAAYANSLTDEEIQTLVNNLSEEEMDQALDRFNALNLTKTGEEGKFSYYTSKKDKGRVNPGQE